MEKMKWKHLQYLPAGKQAANGVILVEIQSLKTDPSKQIHWAMEVGDQAEPKQKTKKAAVW